MYQFLYTTGIGPYKYPVIDIKEM
ncbi:hypothetical protein EYZ11_007229 [Aspergillus tanneri]|uniref:Uncharacterized protein n=1 Tax=Aspergillus tanneri TaxID=1220188 RepID=A0A4V3UP14_9EURO|nr:hypothetical protein EYZ11_007229 [Aspergillus tanneri]